MSRLVICIRKNNSGFDDCRCISKLGLLGGTEITRHRAWEMASADEKALYIRHDGKRHYLRAVESARGTKYVRTEPTDSPDDNLLELPECG